MYDKMNYATYDVHVEMHHVIYDYINSHVLC